MKKPFAFVATLTLTVVLMLVAVPQALACVPPKFSLEATPRAVEEGGSVRITVKADTPSDWSSIFIETVDEDAKTGQDYTGIPKQSLYFGGTPGYSQYPNSYEFTVPVANDSVTEPAETFKVRLSHPRTCSGVGTEEPDGVVVPEPVRVTIAANNAVSTTPATSPALKNSSASGQSPVPSASSPLQSVSSAPFPTPSSGVAAAEKTGENLPGAHGNESSQSPGPRIKAQRKSGDGNKVAIIVIIAVLTTVGTGFSLWKLRRTQRMRIH